MQDQEEFEQFVFGNENDTTEVSTMKDERKDKSKALPKDRIKCTKCGGLFAQRPDVRDNRIEKFGSERKLEDNYLCRDCRKGKVWNGRDWEAKPEKKAKPKAKKKK